VIEYAATCDESIIEDVFHLPHDLEDTSDPFTPLAEPKSGSTDDHSKEPSVEVATPEEASNVVSGDDVEEKETTGEAVKRKAENEETKEEEEGSAEKVSS